MAEATTNAPAYKNTAVQPRDAIGVFLLDLAGNYVNATGDAVIRATAVYKGGTITTGGTSQAWLDANPTRRGFTIQNQSTGDLYIKIGGTAALNNTSLKIAPGVLYETPTHHVSPGAVTIIGATTAQAWYGTEF